MRPSAFAGLLQNKKRCESVRPDRRGFMKQKNVHIISHTHWDREWYIGATYVNEWLPAFFESLFSMLEKEPEYRFVLDGQMCMIEECAEEIRRVGGDTESFERRLRKYAEQGRLVLGPYYLQPDWQLVSGEALVRNMEYGITEAARYGRVNRTGWLLDNFGQIAQAPQIHDLFGVKGLVVWRGIGMSPEHISSEFRWASPDGTAVTAAYLLSSYRNGMRLADRPEIMQKRIAAEAEKIESFSRTGELLMMNGYDQEMRPDDILPQLRRMKGKAGRFRAFQSTPDELLEAICKSGAELPELKGTLYNGRYISVFPGTLSSRIYLKIRNEELQNQLETIAEPLCAMNYLLGGNYPQKELDHVWKLLLHNHPHDSICGVSADMIHEGMERRSTAVERKIKNIMYRAASTLTARLNTCGQDEHRDSFVVFNTLPTARKALITLPQARCFDADGALLVSQCNADGRCIVQVELPPMGATVITAIPEKSAEGTMVESARFENDFYRARLCADGTLQVEEMCSGRAFSGLGYFEDQADSGDEYNFSYLPQDQPNTTLGVPARCRTIERGPLRTVFEVERIWKLPAALCEKRTARLEKTLPVPIVTRITMEADSPVIRFETLVRNVCRDHRLRVVFPTDLDTEWSYAHTQFDLTEHPVRTEAFNNDDLPEVVRRIVIGARESKPTAQYPQCEYVALGDGDIGVAVLNRGLPEYEVLADRHAIALTLFRSVDWLARTDLETRIGDAGPEIYTPDAQCLRDFRFEYAFTVFTGPVRESALLKRSAEYRTRPLVMQCSRHEGENSSFSVLKARLDDSVRVSSFRKDPTREGIRMDLYNVGDEEAAVSLRFAHKTIHAARTDLLGQEKEELPCDSGVRLTIGGRKITPLFVKTVREEMEERSDDVRFVPDEQFVLPKRLQTPFPENVKESDLLMEKMREEQKETLFHQAQAEWEAVQKQAANSPAQKAMRAVCETQLYTAQRTWLESRLSVIYTERKRAETRYGVDSLEVKMLVEKQRPILRKIAHDLNQARVQKRAAEYVQDFFETNAR